MRPAVGSVWKDFIGRAYRVEGILDETGEVYVRLVRTPGQFFTFRDFEEYLTEAA